MRVRLLLVLMFVIATQSWGQSLPPRINKYRVSFGSITRNRQTLLVLR